MKRRKFLSIGTLSLGILPNLAFSFPKNTSNQKPSWLIDLIKKNDAGLLNLEKYRITDFTSPAFGGLKDGEDVPTPQMTSGFVSSAIIAFTSPESAFFQSQELKAKAKLALQYLRKIQHSDGTIDLLSTNFHSTPDTGFIVERLTIAYKLLKNANIKDSNDLLAELKIFLLACGECLIVGGIHTPNHRWVVTNALVKLNEIFPDPRYEKRAEEWLSEHIDLDPDGQYTEKSTGIYSAIVNRALISIADKLKKPELLDFVRKNLQMTLFFVHPNGEAVTDASNRQDKGGISMFENYYFSYRYMAIYDKNPTFAAMCQMIENKYFSRVGGDLDHFLEDTTLWNELPTAQPFSTQFAKYFPYSGVARIRRDTMDATLLVNNPNFLTFHKNNAILQGLRVAASFFGKGQFQSPEIKKEDDIWLMSNKLEGVYYQPFSKEKIDPTGDWEKMPRNNRSLSEVQYLETKVKIKEILGGIEVEFDISGTENVPVTIEMIFRGNGKFSGVQQSEKEPNAYLFSQKTGSYTVGNDSIEFGNGKLEHKALHLRGGLPAANAPTVYLTGFTPFKHTITLK